MLSKEQQQALGDDAVAIVREYEQALLGLIAEQLGNVDMQSQQQAIAAQAVVAVKSHSLARTYRKKMLKAAQRELDAAFYLNEAQENAHMPV